MRLLDTTSLELKEFADDEIPIYAILSHTWGKEEVSFQEMQHRSLDLVIRHQSTPLEKKAGYSKIRGSCKIAAQDGLTYIWIDTCCIDKISSAELTESINSMYKWYQNASVCYAYLSDVPDGDDPREEGSRFAKSRWFTRGWTLQELIGPPSLIFYSQGWQRIARKADLQNEVSVITGVDIEVLRGEDPRSMSIAKRMFWASKRKTTRREDIAYCLMGLFDVNMPLLYGEGEKGFIRLQEEIMKNSDDHTLFAWKELKVPADREYCGLLAPSPAHFFSSQNIVPIRENPRKDPYSITNRGLRIDLALLQISTTDTFLAPLHCTDTTNYTGPVVIILQKLSSRRDDDQFIRIHQTKNFPSISEIRQTQVDPLHWETIYVLQNPTTVQFQDKSRLSRTYGFHISPLPASMGYVLSEVHPVDRWNNRDKILELPDKSMGVAGAILFINLQKEQCLVVVIGLDINFVITVQIESKYNSENWKEAYEKISAELEDNGEIFDENDAPKQALEVEDESRPAVTLYFRTLRALLQGDVGYIVDAIVKQKIVGQHEMYTIDITFEQSSALAILS